MSQTNTFKPWSSGSYEPCIITGGDAHGATKPSPFGAAIGLQSGSDPLVSGTDQASDENLRPLLKDASYLSQCTNNPPLDQGAQLVSIKSPGSVGDGFIVGFPPSVPSSQGTPGNINFLSVLGYLKSINSPDSNVALPPNLKKEMEKRAEIIRAIFKGQHFNGVFQNIPVSGIIGSLISEGPPNEKSIPTAIQKFANILTSGMLSSLPGVSMSLGQMMSMIQSNSSQMSALMQNKTPEFIGAFNSIATLIQQVDSSGGSTLSGFRVNPEKFIENAVNLLSQCNSLNELDTCLQELQSNPAYHGFDIDEILVVYLGEGKGNFSNREDVFQTIDGVKTLIGTVRSWEEDQKILEINKPNKELFSNDHEIYNSSGAVSYIVNSYQYFNEGACSTIEINTPFGKSSLCIDSFGNTREKNSKEAFNQIQSFISQMSSAASAATANLGTNFFGQSAGQMIQMFNRLSGGQFQQATQLLQTLNGANPEKIFQLARNITNWNGGRPFANWPK